jgi:hypothetical protein
MAVSPRKRSSGDARRFRAVSLYTQAKSDEFWSIVIAEFAFIQEVREGELP